MATVKVKKGKSGFFGDKLRNAGDEFDCPTPNEFADIYMELTDGVVIIDGEFVASKADKPKAKPKAKAKAKPKAKPATEE